jgi:CRP-like cAMP-binding protein
MTRNVVLQGSLRFLSLADLFQLLGTNASTGLITLTHPHVVESGRIYLSKGQPFDAYAGDIEGLPALLNLFGWTEGQFQFSQEPVQRANRIRKNRMEVILEALKRIDDGQIEIPGPSNLYPDDSSPASQLYRVKGPMIDYMYVVEEESFEDGDIIIEEGKHGTWIWVILEGQVTIMKHSSRGPLPIFNLAEGSFLGSMASFLMEENIRSAQAVAKGKVQLGVLDSQRLAREFAVLKPDIRSVLLSLDGRLKRITNRFVDVHTGGDRLRRGIYRRPFVREPDRLQPSIVTSGTATLVYASQGDNFRLMDFAPGDFIGGLPFAEFGHEPDSASVLVSEDFAARSLDPQQLTREFERMSPTLHNLFNNLMTNISVTTKLTRDQVQSVRIST